MHKIYKTFLPDSVMSFIFATNRHVLLEPALQMDRQIELDRNSIHSAESI